MTIESEIAAQCTLDPQALRERIAMVRRDVLPLSQHSEALDDGYAWEFPARPDVRETLETWVALEGECCRGGVRFELVEAGPSALRVEVRRWPLCRKCQTSRKG